MADKIKSQKGSRNHKQKPETRYRDSDYDTGYLWGKAGRAKAERERRPKGYLWSEKNRRRADVEERNRE